MKVRPGLYNTETTEVTFDECIAYVVKQEDGYFLDYTDPKEMYEEFLACSEIYVDEEDYKTLENSEEKVTSALLDLRAAMNKENYPRYVEEGAQFMVNAWHEDFEEYSYYPVFGDAREKAFLDTIKFLYDKYCNEKVE
jgi:hypothetical protein